MNRNHIIGGCLIALCSLSLGFGLSQVTVAAQTRDLVSQVRDSSTENRAEIRALKENVAQDRRQTDSRIFEIADLVKKMLEFDKEQQKTQQDFLQILRVQNELLQRKIP